MSNSLREAAHVLRAADKVFITIHVQPDGDAFGSLLAMARCLRRNGKKVCATWGETIIIPAQYSWMPGIDEIDDFPECIGADVLLSLDCANEKRLGWMQEHLRSFKEIINIDHHVDNSRFGTINVVEPDAAATCELIYTLLTELGEDIDEDMATALYTGIVTDTGRFQYSNTTPKTLKVAADLMERGAKPNEIFSQVYENMSFAALKLLAKVLSRAEFVPESQFVYSFITDSDLKESGITMADTESFIDYLRTAKEASAAAILKEASDGMLRISLRSKGIIDIGSIARERGGGGHRNAAGLTVESTIEDAATWLTERLKEQLAHS